MDMQGYRDCTINIRLVIYIHVYIFLYYTSFITDRVIGHYFKSFFSVGQCSMVVLLLKDHWINGYCEYIYW